VEQAADGAGETRQRVTRRSSANAPTPTTARGCNSFTTRRNASSHTSKSGPRSRAGSLSGVRLRAECSMKTSGQ
jgi:hypothetical protein